MKVTKEFHIELAGIPHNSVLLFYQHHNAWGFFPETKNQVTRGLINKQFDLLSHV